MSTVVEERTAGGGCADRSLGENPEAARMAMCQQLESEGAQWAGIMNAATAQLVDVIARAIATDAWFGYGINSPQHWAALRFGLTPHHAKRLVAAAERLESLPSVHAAFVAGELSEDLVSVIVRANPSAANDLAVSELAQHTTVDQLRRALRGIPKAAPTDESSDERSADEPPVNTEEAEPAADAEPDPATNSEAERSEPSEPVRDPSSVSSWFNDDDRWQLRADLNPTDGALVEKALRAAGDRLFNNAYGDDADPALRQKISTVDALMLLCKIGLDALDPATRDHPGRTPSERFMVNLHINADRPDTGAVHLGPLLPKHLRQEATCDALWRLWLEDDYGNVNLGRAARVVDAKLRTVLELRDGCCRYPGCGRTRGLIAHHMMHWEDGGPTDTWNLVLLCAEHHRALHRHEYRIIGDADRHLDFTDPHGHTIGPAPPQALRGPIDEAAADAGMPDPQWNNRTGEHAQWDSLFWDETPDHVFHSNRAHGHCAHGNPTHGNPAHGNPTPGHRRHRERDRDFHERHDPAWPDPWPDPWKAKPWSTGSADDG